MKRVAEIIKGSMKPTGIVPCEGCGARVEAALFFGRIVYACDDCAKPQVFVCGEEKEEG